MHIAALDFAPVEHDEALADVMRAAFAGTAARALRELHQSRNQAERELNRTG